jgi:non-heme chloroperoxidase
LDAAATTIGKRTGGRYNGGLEERNAMIPRPLQSTIALVVFIAGLNQMAVGQATQDAVTGVRFSQVQGGGGVPLNVVEKGDSSKPAILFIHGFRQSYIAWRTQFESRLAEDCHLVAFDLRGHGNSGSPWQADAYNTGRPWADDVDSVIKATGIKAPLIVGWSFGGNVAMDFIRNYPSAHVAGLVLAATTAGMIAQPKLSPDTPPRPTVSSDIERNIGAVDASTKLLFGPNLDADLIRKFAAASMRVSPFVDLLPGLSMPITLVFGGRDPIVNPGVADKLKTLFPRANVVAFPDGGHATFLDDPERFNAMLERLQCKKN